MNSYSLWFLLVPECSYDGGQQGYRDKVSVGTRKNVIGASVQGTVQNYSLRVANHFSTSLFNFTSHCYQRVIKGCCVPQFKMHVLARFQPGFNQRSLGNPFPDWYLVHKWDKPAVTVISWINQKERDLLSWDFVGDEASKLKPFLWVIQGGVHLQYRRQTLPQKLDQHPDLILYDS